MSVQRQIILIISVALFCAGMAGCVSYGMYPRVESLKQHNIRMTINTVLENFDAYTIHVFKHHDPVGLLIDPANDAYTLITTGNYWSMLRSRQDLEKAYDFMKHDLTSSRGIRFKAISARTAGSDENREVAGFICASASYRLSLYLTETPGTIRAGWFKKIDKNRYYKRKNIWGHGKKNRGAF